MARGKVAKVRAMVKEKADPLEKADQRVKAKDNREVTRQSSRSNCSANSTKTATKQSHKKNSNRVGDALVRARGAVPASDRSSNHSLELFGWPDFEALNAKARSEQIEACERVRLLYVATTRARTRLTVSRTQTKAPSHPEKANSLQQLLALRECTGHDPRIESSIEDQPERPRTQRARQQPDGHELATDLAGAVAALEQSRNAARIRAARVRFGAISRETARTARLEEFESEGPHSAPLESRSGGLNPLVAVAVGTALHRFLETFRSADLAEPDVNRVDVATYLADEGSAFLEQAREEYDHGIESLLTNGLLERLAKLEPFVYERELPILLPNDGTTTGTGPLDGYIGTIDLVLRNGEDWTVIDFKSDREEAEDSEQHRRQLELYAEALESAFELDRQPRCEIWYLYSGRIVELSGTAK